MSVQDGYKQDSEKYKKQINAKIVLERQLGKKLTSNKGNDQH